MLLLNGLLLVAIVACLWAIRARAAAIQREETVALAPAIKRNTLSADANIAEPLSVVKPQDYAAVTVGKFAFAKDRNANIIEKPKAAPPEPPMPKLPAVYGLVLFGEKPTIILGRSGNDQRGYQAGDAIGPFKLVEFSGETVVFAWNGKKIERSLTELAQTQTTVAAPAAPAPTATAAAPSAAAAPSNGSFGPALGATERACLAGEASPEGTVVEGFKKVITKSPFGSICRWSK